MFYGTLTFVAGVLTTSIVPPIEHVSLLVLLRRLFLAIMQFWHPVDHGPAMVGAQGAGTNIGVPAAAAVAV
jgi:hypothetical protein